MFEFTDSNRVSPDWNARIGELVTFAAFAGRVATGFPNRRPE
jgi:hypothetical protein